jgi:hypothetical protein
VDTLVKTSALAGTEVDAVVMGACTAPLITTKSPPDRAEVAAMSGGKPDGG